MGMSTGGGGGKKPKPAMNVTPLVDIVLVLLIIFMVVLPNQEKGATVDVPTLDTGEEDPEDEDPFTLSIDRDGRMFFEASELVPDRLAEQLDGAHASEIDRKILLRVDKNTDYGTVRTLFKIAQTVGFPGVMLRVNGNPENNEIPEGTGVAQNP
ncbi:MAG: biopolymer transporter ExbD [Myxococcota bacterium]